MVDGNADALNILNQAAKILRPNVARFSPRHHKIGKANQMPKGL